MSPDWHLAQRKLGSTSAPMTVGGRTSPLPVELPGNFDYTATGTHPHHCAAIASRVIWRLAGMPRGGRSTGDSSRCVGLHC